MTRIFFLAPVLILIPQPTLAAEDLDPDRAQDFLDSCELDKIESGPGEVFGICVGFVDGLIARERVAYREKAYCVPPEASRADALVTLLRYIQEHPAERDQSTGFLALKAFSQAYPCDLLED